MNYLLPILIPFCFWGGFFKGQLAAQDCSVNLLIIYTDQAADSLQGNKAAVEQIMEAAEGINTSFIYSNVAHQINLVRTIRLSEFETDNFIDDLNAFQTSEKIRRLRKKYHADLAALVFTNDEFCGLPYLDDEVADDTTAYCAVNFSCLINSFALSHQLAHLYGCGHFIQVRGEVDPAPYPNGHGYKWRYNEHTSFSTILGVYDDYFCEKNGVDNKDDCDLIPYFSNPSLSYRGVPLGFPKVHDNAAILNQNAAVLGSFEIVPEVQKKLSDTIAYFDLAKATALDTLSTGNAYLIQDTAQVLFTAQDRITLNPGFVANEGVRFETVLEAPSEECKQ